MVKAAFQLGIGLETARENSIWPDTLLAATLVKGKWRFYSDHKHWSGIYIVFGFRV
jgi:hypothetical protein